MSMSSEELDLKTAIQLAGGPEAAAKVCKITPRAVYKWLSSGRLPRTEYTGETNYAELLAEASGNAFSAKQLLQRLKPARSAA